MRSITVNAVLILLAKRWVMGSHNSAVPCWLAAACDYGFKNRADEVLSGDPATHPPPC